MAAYIHRNIKDQSLDSDCSVLHHLSSQCCSFQEDSIISSLHHTGLNKETGVASQEKNQIYTFWWKCHYGQPMKHPNSTAELQEWTVGLREP